MACAPNGLCEPAGREPPGSWIAPGAEGVDARPMGELVAEGPQLIGEAEGWYACGCLPFPRAGPFP